jgi:hypothetical protein
MLYNSISQGIGLYQFHESRVQWPQPLAQPTTSTTDNTLTTENRTTDTLNPQWDIDILFAAPNLIAKLFITTLVFLKHRLSNESNHILFLAYCLLLVDVIFLLPNHRHPQDDESDAPSPLRVGVCRSHNGGEFDFHRSPKDEGW